ncbi:MAG: SMP-30/gluconolactonase/LRE family protein [Kiritimatiellales bacterium]|nr:SMP-30/gluconolactonase/LRE family protein [Kiritimatiellales bacterium]
MKFWKSIFVLAAISTLILSGCATTQQETCGCGKPMDECCQMTGEKCDGCGTGCLLIPTKKFLLPDAANSPDGMTIGADGYIYLAINNVGDQSYPAKIARISPDDKISFFCDLPAHPKTKLVSPLGVAFGSDGNLYVADNQTFIKDAPPLSSRLLRVNIKDGKAVKTEVVLTGMTMANGVSSYGDYIVVNDTAIDTAYPQKSGTYRFTVDELKKGMKKDGKKRPLRVKGLNDPHLIVKLETQNKELQVGANGVGFDSKGNMYVCNFGDAEVWKVTFNDDGSVKEQTVLAQGQGMESCDGLQIDADDNIWVADFLGNAIAKICPETGTVKIVSKNEPGDGADGGFDAPSECIRRGNKVYVSNIDLTFGPNTSDDIHTISVIELP